MRVSIGLAAGALLLATSTNVFAQAPGASADVKTTAGEVVGTATFTQASGGAHLKAQFKNLPPGVHGIHVHAVGKCDGPDFMTAGGHFNPGMKQHGLKNPQGSHAGDLENLTIGADGTGTYDAMLKDLTLEAGTGSLFGPDGTALVVHAMPDDEMTDPSGNSGGRIACGLISRAASAPAAQPSPSPAAKPAAPVTAPAAQPSPAAKPAPAQAPAAKPAVVASPSALPRTGVAGLPFDPTLPAAVTGLGAVIAGLAIWRRRR